MGCRRIKKLLIDYAAGELREKDVLAVKKHLESCDSCRGEYEKTQAVVELLKEDTIEEPFQISTESYTRNVVDRVPEAEERRFTVPLYFPGRVAVATVTALLVFGIAIINLTKDDTTRESLAEITWDESLIEGVDVVEEIVEDESLRPYLVAH